MAVFREYTSDDSFTKIDDIAAVAVSEFQVALTFARDRDGEDLTNGKFIPSWDTTIVTPQVINNVKKRFPSSKVLVSIGNNHGHFPFQIDEDHVSEWIQAATKSLTHIIQEYNLDGLDVYYEEIEVSSPAIFVCSVGEVIKNLKLSKVITRASISPDMCNDTFDKYYWPLYLDYGDFIDHIVLQYSTSWVAAAEKKCRIDHNVLLEKFKGFADNSKLLLGYTGIREDWPSALFPPPDLFVLIYLLLSYGYIIGASITVTRSSITYFPPEWVLDILLLFSNTGSFKLPLLEKKK